MKKRISIFVLAICLLFSLCFSACGKDTKTQVNGLRDVSVECINYNFHPTAMITFTNDKEGYVIFPNSTVTITFYLNGEPYDTFTAKLIQGNQAVRYNQTYRVYISSGKPYPNSGNMTCKVINWDVGFMT